MEALGILVTERDKFIQRGVERILDCFRDVFHRFHLVCLRFGGANRRLRASFQISPVIFIVPLVLLAPPEHRFELPVRGRLPPRRDPNLSLVGHMRLDPPQLLGHVLMIRFLF